MVMPGSRRDAGLFEMWRREDEEKRQKRKRQLRIVSLLLLQLSAVVAIAAGVCLFYW